jgi:hypothetical protein
VPFEPHNVRGPRGGTSKDRPTAPNADLGVRTGALLSSLASFQLSECSHIPTKYEPSSLTDMFCTLGCLVSLML